MRNFRFIPLLMAAGMVFAACDSDGDGESITGPQLGDVTVEMFPQGGITCTAGDTARALAVVKRSGRDINSAIQRWTSRDTGIATVDGNGLVTCRLGGTTLVIARPAVDTTVTGEVSVTVKAPPPAPVVVRISPESSTLIPGGTQQMSKEVFNSDDKNVRWSSTQPGVATVSNTGLVTAHAVGAANIVATHASGAADAALVRVEPAQVANAPCPYEGAQCVFGRDSLHIRGELAAANVTELEMVDVTVAGQHSVLGRARRDNRGGFAGSLGNLTVDVPRCISYRVPGQTGFIALNPWVDGASQSVKDRHCGNNLDGWSARLFRSSATGQVSMVTATQPPPPPQCTVGIVPGNGSTFNVPVGGQEQLTSSTSGSCGSLTWASDNPNIASVDQTGQVIGASVGQTRVTLTSSSTGVQGHAIINVTQPSTISVVTISGQSGLTVGQSADLTAACQDSGGTFVPCRTVAWSSNNPNVARVDQTGRVTGVSAGQADISATAGGKTGTLRVTVTAPAVTFNCPAGAAVTANLGCVAGQSTVIINPAVAPGAQTVNVLDFSTGQTITLGAATLTGRGLEHTFTFTGTADRCLGFQVPGGNPTPLNQFAAGNTQDFMGSDAQGWCLKARRFSSGQYQLGAEIIVETPVLTVTPTTATIDVGGTQDFDCELRQMSGETRTDCTWSVSPPSVASIDVSTGLARGLSAGTATVTASHSGVVKTATLVVRQPPATCTLTRTSASTVTLTSVGATHQITWTASGCTGNPTFTVNPTSGVATVSGSGLVTAVANGTATITTSLGGQSFTTTVVVEVPPPSSANAFEIAGNNQVDFMSWIGDSSLQVWKVTDDRHGWSSSSLHDATRTTDHAGRTVYRTTFDLSEVGPNQFYGFSCKSPGTPGDQGWCQYASRHFVEAGVCDWRGGVKLVVWRNPDTQQLEKRCPPGTGKEK